MNQALQWIKIVCVCVCVCVYKIFLLFDDCWTLGVAGWCSGVVVGSLGMEFIGPINSRCKTEFGLVEPRWSEKRMYVSELKTSWFM